MTHTCRCPNSRRSETILAIFMLWSIGTEGFVCQQHPHHRTILRRHHALHPAEYVSVAVPSPRPSRRRHICAYAMATGMPSTKPADGLEHGPGHIAVAKNDENRRHKAAFEASVGCGHSEGKDSGGNIAYQKHGAEEKIKRTGSKHGSCLESSEGEEVVPDVFSGCEREPDEMEWSSNDPWQSNTLHQLQKVVRELELEVERLRKGSHEEDDGDIVLGACRFSRQGAMRRSATETPDLLLYLPGVDGLNIEAVQQCDSLSSTFDTWCMTVHGRDKSTFEELTLEVLQFLNFLGATEERQVVIVGTSFGGLLALNVAHQSEQRLKGLVLVNPATSFHGSVAHIVGSFVAHAPGPEAFGLAAVLALAATVPDTAKMSTYMSEFEALPPQEVPRRLKDLVDQWLGLTLSLFDETPQENLKWRLKHWLGEGSTRVEPLLGEIRMPVLVLAGSEDHMLPSVDEAERLSDLIPTCQKIILRGVGHAALHDPGEANLAKLIKSSVLYDKRLLDRIRDGKEAKRASKRWQKESISVLNKHSADNNTGRTGDPVLDFKLDLDDEMVKLVWRSTEAMDRFTSPIFLSISKNGQLEEGLGSVPDYEKGRSILFVGNHQLLGIDMPIVVRKLLADKNILVRGLAHPVVSGTGDMDFLGKMRETDPRKQQTNTADARGPIHTVRRAARTMVNVIGATAGNIEASGLAGVRGVFAAATAAVSTSSSFARRVIRRDRKDQGTKHEQQRYKALPDTLSERLGVVMTKLGAVPVTPRNMLKLLRAGESILLYPGGAKEALHQKGEAYQTFWPDKSEFVRMAASCNATIVPFAAIGAADSLEILMDLDEMFSLPFGLGEQLHIAADLLPRARAGDDKEYFVPPLACPRVPARHYFLFGRPIDTSVVDERDREACQVVYDRARLSVEAGIDYLLKARQHDPYGDGAKRLLYETVMRTQAPTFALDVVCADRLAWYAEDEVDVETKVRR